MPNPTGDEKNLRQELTEVSVTTDPVTTNRIVPSNMIIWYHTSMMHSAVYTVARRGQEINWIAKKKKKLLLSLADYTYFLTMRSAE